MNIEVNMDTLGKDIESLETTVALARKAMQEAFDAIAELDQMWDGSANSAFNQQFLTDREMFESLCQAVDGVTESMTNANALYIKCAGAVEEQVNLIKV